MDLTFHGISEKVLWSFSVKASDLSWLSSVSPLVLLGLLTKLNSKWHICKGNHLCPDTFVNYGSSLGVAGWSKGLSWQAQSLSVLCQWLPWVTMTAATSGLWILQHWVPTGDNFSQEGHKKTSLQAWLEIQLQQIFLTEWLTLSSRQVLTCQSCRLTISTALCCLLLQS